MVNEDRDVNYAGSFCASYLPMFPTDGGIQAGIDRMVITCHSLSLGGGWGWGLGGNGQTVQNRNGELRFFAEV